MVVVTGAAGGFVADVEATADIWVTVDGDESAGAALDLSVDSAGAGADVSVEVGVDADAVVRVRLEADALAASTVAAVLDLVDLLGLSLTTSFPASFLLSLSRLASDSLLTARYLRCASAFSVDVVGLTVWA